MKNNINKERLGPSTAAPPIKTGTLSKAYKTERLNDTSKTNMKLLTDICGQIILVPIKYFSYFTAIYDTINKMDKIKR